MQDEMIRGRSQVIWRYMPDAIFRYKADGAWCLVADVSMQNTTKLEGTLINALAEKLIYWNALVPTGFPDPRTQPHKYVVGEPYWVRYDIWPTIFMCNNCKSMHWYRSLSNLKQYNENLRCRFCKNDTLKQAFFAYVCSCGSIETLFLQNCPTDNKHPVQLIDRGNFQDSYWYCPVCKKPIQRNSQDGLGVRACRQCGKTMRGIILIDPRIYYSQTIAIVDIQPNILASWKDNENFSTLLKGAVFRIPNYKASDIQNLSKYKSTKEGLAPELVEMRKMLLEQGMKQEQVEDLIQKSVNKGSTDPWKQYDKHLSECEEFASQYEAGGCQQTVEYVFVRDEPSTIKITLDNLIAQASTNQDSESYSHYTNDKHLAHSLGLINMAVIQELPILLAGVGYTRFASTPIDFDGVSNGTQLRPYKIEDDGKIPIYVAKNTTEAFMYELDPWRMAAFLEVNQAIKIPPKAKTSDYLIRAWLLSISSRLQEVGESHLHLLSFEQERGLSVDLPTGLMFGVLHTISHVLKATAHQYVGIDQDSLAEYLFPLHLSGLLYVSSHVKFTLGGIDAVFRSNLQQWLGTSRDFTNSCSFDPVCTQDGGACLACLYTKFGCNYFNRTLSRSFLFGGNVRGMNREIAGFWSSEVTNLTKNLKVELVNCK